MCCVWLLIMNCGVQILQGLVTEARKQDRSIYVFNVDVGGQKVAHVNFVSSGPKGKGLDGRKWAEEVIALIGGKAGGKVESAQGMGTTAEKAEDAKAAAEKYFASFV
jgi:alanyl-tRNA synthetase